MLFFFYLQSLNHVIYIRSAISQFLLPFLTSSPVPTESGIVRIKLSCSFLHTTYPASSPTYRPAAYFPAELSRLALLYFRDDTIPAPPSSNADYPTRLTINSGMLFKPQSNIGCQFSSWEAFKHILICSRLLFSTASCSGSSSGPKNLQSIVSRFG